MEHAKLDGTTVLDLVDAVLGEPAPEDAPPVFAAYAADTATALLSYADVGTERIRARGTSPDAFVQLAHQLAHVRTKGHVGATYESIATRQPRHGRTEAMRVVTPEVLAFVAAMDEAGADADARRSAYHAPALAHTERARQCQQGQAPEQHLWELQMLQRRLATDSGAAAPIALYDSPGWTVMRDDFSSTSSAPSRHLSHFGFGSTSAHCIGIAYVLLPDRLNLFLSTPRAVGGHLEVFALELTGALAELDELLADEPATG